MTPSSNEIIIHPSTYRWIKNVEHGTTSLGGQLENRFTLRIEEEIIFKKNMINLIVGPTASGKTSLLMALLGQYAVSRAA
jgi:type II secretory ATPase GspE/PulE/Tfp pilus assembly ATPase PilB-like protein